MPRLIQDKKGPAKSIIFLLTRWKVIPTSDVDLQAAENLGLQDKLATPLIEEDARKFLLDLNNEANRLRTQQKTERKKVEKNRRKDELIEENGNWQVRITWKTISGGWCEARGELNDLKRDQTVYFTQKVNTGNCSILFLQKIIDELERAVYYEDRLDIFTPVLTKILDTLNGVKLIRA